MIKKLKEKKRTKFKNNDLAGIWTGNLQIC